MLPEIIDYKIQDGILYSVFSNGRIGAVFKIRHLDCEVKDEFSYIENLEDFFKTLNPNLNLRILSQSQKVFESDKTYPRSKTFEKIGHVKHNLILSFEIKPAIFSTLKNIKNLKSLKQGNFEAKINEVKRLFNLSYLKQIGLEVLPISNFDELKEFFFDSQKTFKNDGFYLYDGHNYLSVLKLKSFGNYPLDYLSMARLKRILPNNHIIIGHYKVLDRAKSKFHISRISRREETGRGAVSDIKYQTSEETLGDLELGGEELVKFELHILLKSPNKEHLKNLTKHTLADLSGFGEFVHESVGAFPAYVSTLIGANFHLAGDFSHLVEKSKTLPCFLPLFIFGNDKEPLKKGLPYHREDLSQDFFNPFLKENDNFNSIVLAKSGRGKSVFTNLLIRALSEDHNIKLIVTDVKGSHTRTLSELKGETIDVSLDKPCGINPLELLKDESSFDVLELVTSFLEQLILEREESFLPIKEKTKLENIILAYSKSKPKNPSIDDFLKFSPTFPRKELLERWSSSGLYRAVFSQKKIKEENPKLKYYNFKNFSSAQNPALIRGIVSAVMSDFLKTVLKARTGERFLFISDEVPFLLKHCFEVYASLAKNLRKMGGGLFLIAQSTNDLTKDGKDLSLIEQASHKVLFSLEGKKEEFKKILSLNSSDIEKLKSLRTVKGEFSQFLIKSENVSKTGLLILSEDEYYKSTTFDEDLKKINEVKKCLPHWVPHHIVASLLPIYLKEVKND